MYQKKKINLLVLALGTTVIGGMQTKEKMLQGDSFWALA